MNIFKTDIGVKSDNFILKITLSTIIAFSTIVVMYYLFRV